MKDAILARWNLAATHLVFSRKKLDVSSVIPARMSYALANDLSYDLE